MRSWIASLLVAVFGAASLPAADEPGIDWMDAATGHRVIRLSQDPGGSSLYFHQNTYTPEGDKLIFDTRAGIVAVDITKLGKEPVKPELVVREARAISMAIRTPDVYGRKSFRDPAAPLYATNVDTKETR